MHESWEVKYRTRELGVSSEELQKVGDKVGNSAATVRKELATVEQIPLYHFDLIDSKTVADKAASNCPMTQRPKNCEATFRNIGDQSRRRTDSSNAY
jgi:hypothetical protein